MGQPVRHALGVGNIEEISSRPTFEIMKLELNNGRIIECTPKDIANLEKIIDWVEPADVPEPKFTFIPLTNEMS